ncbi:MAG TPA: twin-arginine translocase TatA/TatE family subunit [Opitutaceae bacterium]|nr:twin-arginine translocase TatA/TatE family subunit [Opitutaceae bacterium]
MHPHIIAVFGVSGSELLIVLGIIVLLFGATKLPALARGIGQSIKEFKKAAQDEEANKTKKTDEKSGPI